MHEFFNLQQDLVVVWWSYTVLRSQLVYDDGRWGTEQIRSAAVPGRTRIQWNPDLTRVSTTCLCVPESFPETFTCVNIWYNNHFTSIILIL